MKLSRGRLGLILCLFGADGSGKTTIARHLSAYLSSRGVNNIVVWMRGTHTFAAVLARFLARFDVFRGRCNPYYNICIPRRMRSLWMLIELISVIPIIVLRFALPKLLGRVVIAERSPIDFLLWLVTTVGREGFVWKFIANVTIALARSLCDVVVYVRADERVLITRKRGSKEVWLIPVQLRVYDGLAKALGVSCIDTSRKSVSEVVAEVLKLVGECIE